MTRDDVDRWISQYERAWRTPGTEMLPGLFTEDAVYLHSPYAEPIDTPEDLARSWEEEREGPDELFTMTWQVLAVDGDTAVARVQVSYGEPLRQEYLDLWVMRFAPDGRCREFEEWAYWPGLAWSANG